MNRWIMSIGLCGLLGVLSCAENPDGVARQYEPAAEQQQQHFADLQQSINEIADAELHWRLPNSHASTLSGDARCLQSELLRGRIMRQTLQIARNADAPEVEELMHSNREAAADDEFRVIVVCRLLAACGRQPDEILASTPVRLRSEEVIRSAISEGQALRELL